MEILKEDNLFIKVITNVLKCFYLSQYVKWERALGKPMDSIVESILIWVHHHPHGGLALRIRIYGLSTWTRLDMFVRGSNHPHSGVLHLVTLIVQGQWLYTRHWIWSGRIVPCSPTCIVYAPNKRYLAFRYLYG